MRLSCHWDETFRAVPFAQFLAVNFALVHPYVAIGIFQNRITLQRARRWAFEVDAGDVIAGAVAGAFEFLVALQPVGDATEVGAGRAQRDEFVFGWGEVDHPNAVGFVLFVDAGHGEVRHRADSELLLSLIHI